MYCDYWCDLFAVNEFIRVTIFFKVAISVFFFFPIREFFL